MHVRLGLSLAVFLVVFVNNVNAECDSGEINIRFSHSYSPETHPIGISAAALAKRINDEMQGEACMKVFSDSMAYKPDEEIAALLNGQIELAVPTLSYLNSYSKKFRIFDLPFLFMDYESVDSYQRSAKGNELKHSLVDKGLLGLDYWHIGMVQMPANKLIVEPDDISGLKLRNTLNEATGSFLESLGASRVSVRHSDLFQALDTGTVDGLEGTWQSINEFNFDDNGRFVTETNHLSLDALLMVRDEWWNGLPDNSQVKIKNIVESVSAIRNAATHTINTDAKASLSRKGVAVYELSNEQRRSWSELAKPTWESLKSDIGVSNLEAAYSFCYPD